MRIRVAHAECGDTGEGAVDIGVVLCFVAGETGECGIDFGRRDEGGRGEGRGIAFCALETPSGFWRCEDGSLKEVAATAEGGDCGWVVRELRFVLMDFREERIRSERMTDILLSKEAITSSVLAIVVHEVGDALFTRSILREIAFGKDFPRFSQMRTGR
jgi:hypothetical protein